MDIPHEVIIEVALNIIGYLAAGALSILIYRNFARPKAGAVPRSNITLATPDQPDLRSESPSRTKDDINLEIVTFGSSPAEKLAASANKPTINRLRGRAASPAGRDRADIIRIAKEMMKAGATAEKIKGVIPISEAELSLLSMGKNG